MRAWVIEEPGGPEILRLRDVPDPEPRDGQVLIEVKAFGLNRAEAITRAGGSGDAMPSATAMGGMGRSFDGSYAERTVVPRANVFPVETSLSWTELGAVPETFLTAWGRGPRLFGRRRWSDSRPLARGSQQCGRHDRQRRHRTR